MVGDADGPESDDASIRFIIRFFFKLLEVSKNYILCKPFKISIVHSLAVIVTHGDGS